MKKYATIILFILLGSACTRSQGWFKVTETTPKTWTISDNGSDNMYLVEGRDSALLIDTGLGSADIASLAGSLTNKPLIVLNTHAHPDHSGGNYQFEKIYIHPEDIEAARTYNPSSGGNTSARQGSKPPENELFKGKPFDTKILPLDDGRIFDLGGRRIQVIYAPGHTPGEICLLDIDNKVLFTGDNTNSLVWLFLPNCKPLHEYLTTLEMLDSRSNEYFTIMPGHGTPLPAGFIKDQIACVKGILSNTIESKPYESSFSGTARVSEYGSASVVFNPENL
ncbi:MAG TPA: MBL fold metallo-hydrolase [Bacteroidales bacterium]|nr:MBL fold metallo-hydrolase [Bacteroidales bacterium]